MRGKAILIALLLVLLMAGGGAAAWVATKDKDHSGSQLLSSAPESTSPARPAQDPTQAAPTTPPDTTSTEEQPRGTSPTAPTSPATPPEQAPPTDQSPAAPKQKTHFKRESVKSTNDEPERKFAVPPAREFSGDGNARLGTVNVKTNAILRWRSKGRLEIRFGRENFPIVAPTRTGQLVLPPFLFEQVRVLAARPWKITISPQ
jgi:hypothetical protein